MAEGDEEILSMQDELKILALDANLLKFCRLLAFIDSPVVPESLFNRATRTRAIWTESGELGYVPPDHSKVPYWLVQLFDTKESAHENPLLQQAVKKGILSMPREDDFQSNFRLEEKWRNALRIGLSLASSLEYLFDVLAVVIQSFPEPQAEILWEETEEQLWSVIESTVLPLLAVSTVRDILAHGSTVDASGQRNFLQVLLSFLSRITAILGKYSYPSISQLHEDLFEHFLEVSCDPAPASQDVLPCFLFYAPSAVQRSNLLHLQSNERLNAAQVFNRNYSPDRFHENIADVRSWTPLSRGKPSTMETLAMSSFHGASTVLEMFRIFLYSLPPQVVALLGFIAAKQQSFEAARYMLELSLTEVKELYEAVSIEYLITGIELVKCYNFLMEGTSGEKLARKLWSEVFEPKGGSMNITSIYRAHLAIVLSDSLISQAKYNDAEEILLSILEYQGVPSDLIVTASLRLLKMSRRQRKECPNFDTWQILEMAIGCIDHVSDELKYECVEEAMCHVSVLDEDPAQIPRAEAVVTALSRISIIKHFSGSETSKQNLMSHMCALRQYRTGFKLFSVTGPQLHFSRLIRDGFPSASIAFIERIGTANWNRFNRVKELPLRAEIIMDGACHTDGRTVAGMSEGTFTDSALGSSLQTASKRARTQISYQSVGSAIGGSLENFPPMPVPSSKGKPLECPICCKRLRGIVSNAQWEHHVYADLQPYVCILDKCSSRTATFGSRLEFTNHMSEHQHSVVWSCKACQYTQNESAAIEEHIAKSHPDLDVKLTAISANVRRNMAEEPCPFCGIIPGLRFIGHICRHLEEVALSILPKEVEWDSGSEDGGSDSDRSKILCEFCESYGHDILTCSGLAFREKTHPFATKQDATGQKGPIQFGSLRAEDISRTLQSSHSISELGNVDQGSRSIPTSPDLAAILDSSSPLLNSNHRAASPTLSPSLLPIPPLSGGRLPSYQQNVPSFGFLDSERSPQDSPPDKDYDWDKYFPIIASLYYNLKWTIERIHRHIQDPAAGFTPSLEDIWSKFGIEERFPEYESDFVDRKRARPSSSTSSPYPRIPDVDFNALSNRRYYGEIIAFQFDPNSSSRRFLPPLPPSDRSAIYAISQYLGLGYESTMSHEAESYVEISKPQFYVPPQRRGRYTSPLEQHWEFSSIEVSGHLRKSSMIRPGHNAKGGSTGDDPPLGHSRMTPTGEVSLSHQPFYLHPQFAAKKDLEYLDDEGDFTPMYQELSSRLPSGTVKHTSNRFGQSVEAPNESHNPEPEMMSNTRTAIGWGSGTIVEPDSSNPRYEDYWDWSLGPDGLSPFKIKRPFYVLQEQKGQRIMNQHEINRYVGNSGFQDFQGYIPGQHSGQASSSRDEASSAEQIKEQNSPANEQPAFQLPRKNAAITIKRPDGTPLDLSNARVSTVSKFVQGNIRKSKNAMYCPECNVEFTKITRWKKHLKMHRGQSIRCGVNGCAKKFYTVEEKTDHELQHVTCTVEGCGKQFVGVKERREHYRTHAVEAGEAGGPSTG